MANLSKKFLGFAATAITFAGMAQAQSTCTAGGVVPSFIRAEGTTELVAPVTINCSGAPASGTAIVQLYLSPAQTVTSKVLSTTSGAITEAVAQVAGSGGTATVNGTVTGAGQLTFSIPSASLGTGNFTITISNIRVNASTLSVGSGIPPAISATAFLSGTSVVAGSLTLGNVAFVQAGLGATKVLKSVGGSAGANSFTICNSVTAGSAAFVVQVNEGFAQSFKTLADESSPVAQAVGSTNNTVNSGTRIQVTFANLPNSSSLAVYVPTSVNTATAGSSAKLTLVTSATASDAGGVPAVPASTASAVSGLQVGAVTASGGTATAYYEVTSDDLANLDTFNIPVYFVAAAGLPASGTSTVAVSFAPIGATTIPNFVQTSSTTTVNGSSFNLCTTSLLFPFVTNNAGFDTGIAIANTSVDPFGANGAPGQDGTCTLNFYGAATNPAAVTTPTVNRGTVYTTLNSIVAPGFQGYMIAQCNFQFAHAFAFITDGFGGPGRGLSQGYLALVIADPNQTSRRSNPTGEFLEN